MGIDNQPHRERNLTPDYVDEVLRAASRANGAELSPERNSSRDDYYETLRLASTQIAWELARIIANQQGIDEQDRVGFERIATTLKMPNREFIQTFGDISPKQQTGWEMGTIGQDLPVWDYQRIISVLMQRGDDRGYLLDQILEDRCALVAQQNAKEDVA